MEEHKRAFSENLVCWIAEAEEFKYSDRLQLEEIFLFGIAIVAM